ncbi:complement factor B-like [Pelobates fuscus]|uniref:complement factor B-like n=1 Tax=Pelobates fuscus TaxID=191477 RepID=UPI002FE436D9
MKMLLILLFIHVAASIPAYRANCNLDKIQISGGSYSVNEDGNVVTYSCPSGMYPHPGPIRECLSYGWTKQNAKFVCKNIRCPSPAMFENGVYDPKKKLYNIGDVLQFECWSGFELKGSVNRTCQVNGKWSGKTAICEDNGGHCPNPGVPIGTTKTGITYGVENKVFYKCKPGFDMFGSSVRECTEDKYWSGTEPSCREWYTFDTPEEVAEMFSATLAANIEAADPDKEGKDINKRKVRIKKGDPMNIFIILDASKSVQEKDFNTAKQSSITFIEKVSSFDIDPRYSIISYASEAIPVVRLSDEESVEADKVIDKLYEFKYGAHGDMKGTNTRSAFRSLYEMLVLQELREKAQFMKIRNVILLMTDGKYNMGGDPNVELEKIKLFLEIGKSREDFLDVYVFGLGDGTDNNELNVLASKKPNEQHTFRLQNIDHMKKAFDSIIDETDAMDMCGLNKEIIDAVFNDTNTDENKKKTLVNEKFPWIAKITITRPGSQETCKGSILTKNFILTAAHCFHFDDETKHINVQVGTESLPVKNLYRHPQFDQNAKKDKNINSTFDYDVALLELGRKISYSSTARPICIPCTKSSSWALRMKGEHITCKDHEDFLFKEEQIKSLFIAEEDKKLMEQKDVTIKTGNTRLACLRATEQVKEFKDIADIRDMVTDQFLCTGGTDPHVEPPTCKGDSGGPLIIEYKKRYIQVGIISWGSVNHCNGTKRKTTPVPELSRDFHISILSMLPWIENTVTEELTYLPK